MNISPKRIHKITSEYMKKCSTSLVITEMQIKTTVRSHFTKRQKITSVGKDMEKLELSYIAGGNVKW